MSTAEQRAWEREQERLLEQAGEEEAGRLNQVLQDRVGALEQLLAWSLAHPVTVDFSAMKLPPPQSGRSVRPVQGDACVVGKAAAGGCGSASSGLR